MRFTSFLARGGLALLFGMLLLGPPAALAQGGRSFSRCIHACNDIRAACYDHCAADCTVLYSNDPGRFAICVSTCQAVCDVHDGECKTICKEFKNPIPDEP